jgi:hypothetical protein
VAAAGRMRIKAAADVGALVIADRMALVLAFEMAALSMQRAGGGGPGVWREACRWTSKRSGLAFVSARHVLALLAAATGPTIRNEHLRAVR